MPIKVLHKEPVIKLGELDKFYTLMPKHAFETMLRNSNGSITYHILSSKLLYLRTHHETLALGEVNYQIHNPFLWKPYQAQGFVYVRAVISYEGGPYIKTLSRDTDLAELFGYNVAKAVSADT